MAGGNPRAEVRVSGIPFSPNDDQMAHGDEKKQGFWKRLSVMPVERSGELLQTLYTRCRAYFE